MQASYSGKGSCVTVSIILITQNCINSIARCLSDLDRFTSQIPYELIIIDNCSNDGTREFLNRYYNEHVPLKKIYNNSVLGSPACYNKGFMISRENTHKIIMDGSVCVTERWLKKMLDILLSRSNTGAVNCNITGEDNTAGALETTVGTNALILRSPCIIIKNTVFEKLGGFDEEYKSIYYTSADYCLKMIAAGFSLAMCEDTHLFSLQNTPFSDSIYRSSYLSDDQLFYNKWGFYYGYSCNSNEHLLRLINRNPKAKMNILDMGCACGANFIWLNQKFKNASLYGIEINEKASAIASMFAEIQTANIEEGPLDAYPDNFFDYIIMADVIEHLKDPWAALAAVQKKLKPLGHLLMSIPNISHISVIYKILYLSFEYENSGVLDKTHLRFFSLNDIHRMLADAGFTITQMFSYTQIINDPVLDNLINDLTAITGENKRQYYQTYQYQVDSTKNSL